MSGLALQTLPEPAAFESWSSKGKGAVYAEVASTCRLEAASMDSRADTLPAEQRAEAESLRRQSRLMEARAVEFEAAAILHDHVSHLFMEARLLGFTMDDLRLGKARGFSPAELRAHLRGEGAS